MVPFSTMLFPSSHNMCQVRVIRNRKLASPLPLWCSHLAKMGGGGGGGIDETTLFQGAKLATFQLLKQN